MATLNPRITVTLTPELHAVMRRLSELTGNSQSAIVGEMLSTSMPALVRVVKVMEAASTAQSDLNEGIASGLSRAQDRIEAQLGFALGVVDEVSLPILQAAEKVRRRGRKGGLTPVPVTRGSGLKNRAPRAPKKGAIDGPI
jgi:hypothetical protein